MIVDIICSVAGTIDKMTVIVVILSSRDTVHCITVLWSLLHGQCLRDVFDITTMEAARHYQSR